jgi:hypothetical protein
MFLAGAGMFSMRLYPVQDDAFRQNVVEELRYQGEKTQPPGRGEVRIEINHFAKTGSGQTSKGRAPKKTAPPVYRFSSSDPADAPPRDCPLGFEQRGKETASFAPFFTKQDHVLQRQARDKHRESTHKREWRVFLQNDGNPTFYYDVVLTTLAETDGSRCEKTAGASFC